MESYFPSLYLYLSHCIHYKLYLICKMVCIAHWSTVHKPVMMTVLWVSMSYILVENQCMLTFFKTNTVNTVHYSQCFFQMTLRCHPYTNTEGRFIQLALMYINRKHVLQAIFHQLLTTLYIVLWIILCEMTAQCIMDRHWITLLNETTSIVVRFCHWCLGY